VLLIEPCRLSLEGIFLMIRLIKMHLLQQVWLLNALYISRMLEALWLSWPIHILHVYDLRYGQQ
jgi:hypothetical protein